MNNSIVVTPSEAKDYGVYVCHASNSFGSTAYKVTLSECQKCSIAPDTTKGDNSEFYQIISHHTAQVMKVRGPNGYCVGLRIERSGFESWLGHHVVFLDKTIILTVPLFTQMYIKWVLGNLLLGLTLRWTSIPYRGDCLLNRDLKSIVPYALHI